MNLNQYTYEVHPSVKHCHTIVKKKPDSTVIESTMFGIKNLIERPNSELQLEMRMRQHGTIEDVCFHAVNGEDKIDSYEEFKYFYEGYKLLIGRTRTINPAYQLKDWIQNMHKYNKDKISLQWMEWLEKYEKEFGEIIH